MTTPMETTVNTVEKIPHLTSVTKLLDNLAFERAE